MAIVDRDDTAAAAVHEPRHTRRQVRGLLRADRLRLRQILSQNGLKDSIVHLLFPAYACVWLYRWSHYFARLGRRRLARACWLINVYLTGADIDPRSELGGGLYIPHPACVSIHCRAGRDLTVMAAAGVGPCSLPNDYDSAMDAVPEIGDSVVVSYHARVCGPVRVGDGVYIAPGCVIDFDVVSGTAMVGPRPDIREVSRRGV